MVVEDLPPGSITPYEVRLDDAVVWPPADGRPPCVIRTRHCEREAKLVFGSCRVGAPQSPPYYVYVFPTHRLTITGPNAIALGGFLATACLASYLLFRARRSLVELRTYRKTLELAMDSSAMGTVEWHSGTSQVGSAFRRSRALVRALAGSVFR